MRRRLPQPPRRWLRWTAVGILAFAGHLLVVVAVENWRAEREWQSFRLYLNAQGHLLEPPESNERRLADEQNFLKAPLAASWFTPDRILFGEEPPRMIQLNRPGDALLAGSWADVRPANLKEWRQFFQRPVAVAPVPIAETNTPLGSIADEVAPLIVIDDVPLVDAIRNLARQAKLKIRFNSSILESADDSQSIWQQPVSLRFENLTARQVLAALVEGYGVMLLTDPKNGVVDLSRALASPSGWPHEIVDLETEPLPPCADEALPMVTFDGTPGADAVRNAAQQAGINILFDGRVRAESLARYSLALFNVTPRQLLARVLADQGLALKSSSQSSIYRVVRYQVPGMVQPDNTAAGVLASLAGFDEEFRALYAASERPACRSEEPIRRRHLDRKAAPNYIGFWKVPAAVGLHASAHLALDHPDIALRDATVIARLVEALHNRRDLVGAMMRAGVSARYQQVVWEGLASRRWNESQLKILERQMESVDLLSTCERALLGEQAQLSAWMEQTPRAQMAMDLRELTRIIGRPNPPSAMEVSLEWFVRTCPQGWIRQNQLRAMERFEEHFALLDASNQRVYPENEHRLKATLMTGQWTLHPYDCLARAVGPIYSGAIENTARCQNGLNMARVACALERYRLRHGRFPKALADLTPQFMESLPTDLMTGSPLNYRTTGDGQFVLHSAGWNHPLRGSVATISSEWIWRYPAR